ncbi:MAG TPA: hypothetical protein VMG12_39260 [Polyangiaceae bacterium]|nr:hypothetical protein [Polyangiaceae bacterium]
MSASNRVLHAILDHMLQMLPDEPADSKRLDDIIDADANTAQPPLPDSMVAGSAGTDAQRHPSGMRPKSGAKLSAAS